MEKSQTLAPFTRKATLGDVQPLLNLLTQLGYDSINEEQMRKKILDYSQDPYLLWVAESNGKIVGCLALHIMEAFHLPGSSGRILVLVVDQTQRRQGIARLLMQKAEEYARSQKCLFIELTSGMHRKALGSHDFYLQLGYEIMPKAYFKKKL